MELRPPRLDEAPALERLINASTRADIGMVVYRSGDLLRNWEKGESFEQHVLAVDEEGEPQGLLWVEDAGQRSGPVELHLTFGDIYFELFLGEGAPDGLTSALIDEVEQRGEARARETGDEVGLEVNSGEPATVRLLEARGYRRGRTHLAMTVELVDLPRPLLPPGFRFRDYREGDDDEVFWRTLREGFADDWVGPDDRAAWFQKHRAEGYVPGLWFLVEGDTGVLGAAHSRDTWENDVETGWVRNLAVLPEGRRLGVGRALVIESFRRLAERGRRRAVLGVEEGNVAALRLYESIGMQARGRSTDLFKTILPPGGGTS